MDHQNGQKPILQASPPTCPMSKLTGALSTPCSHHGKPLRGLMSTANPPSSKGRFGRMFNLPAATYGKTEEESRAALMELGKAMAFSVDGPKDGFDAEESGIPALYTYFGQFIDHDITFDPVSSLLKHSDPDALNDFRTPALDLDNMYGRGPDDQPYMYDNNGTKFLLGNRLDNGAFDLQRNNAVPARALIGDPRNDENTIISQFQALMLRFHNRVVDSNPGLDFASLQRIVRWHYQWVVIHDFLPRIIRANVIDSLKTDGLYDEKKLKFYHWKSDPVMPVEFSVAAYRLGHSMIRPGYRLNDNGDTPLPIFPTPPAISSDVSAGLTGFVAMAKDRGIDWGRYIDVGEPRPRGGDPDDPANQPATKDMRNRLQFAYRIDSSVVNPLSFLPISVAPDAPPVLAQRNLLRGFELGLPTGQSVARAIGVTPLTDAQITIGKAVDVAAPADPATGDPGDNLGSIAKLSTATDPTLGAALAGNCPLWTYVLAEAMDVAQAADVTIPVAGPPITVKTPQLGEVGGCIVAEVFLGMLFGDRNSFLAAEPKWTPTIGTAKGDFKLRDIVAYALGPESSLANGSHGVKITNGISSSTIKA